MAPHRICRSIPVPLANEEDASRTAPTRGTAYAITCSYVPGGPPSGGWKRRDARHARTTRHEGSVWPDGHVSIRQLVDYFATYVYLPRLASPEVRLGAIKAGLALLTWTSDSLGIEPFVNPRFRPVSFSRPITALLESAGRDLGVMPLSPNERRLAHVPKALFADGHCSGLIENRTVLAQARIAPLAFLTAAAAAIRASQGFVPMRDEHVHPA